MEKTMKKRRFTKIIACCSALVLMAAGVAGSTMSASAATVRGNYTYDKTENFDKYGGHWSNHYRASTYKPTAYVKTYLQSGETGKWTIRFSQLGFSDYLKTDDYAKANFTGMHESNIIISPYFELPHSMNLSTTRYTSSGAQQQDNYYTAK